MLISGDISVSTWFHEMGSIFMDASYNIMSKSSRNSYEHMPMKGSKAYLYQMVPCVFRVISQYLRGSCSGQLAVDVRKQGNDELYHRVSFPSLETQRVRGSRPAK